MALICYLDDSDHFEDPAVTMAGFVASDRAWRLFEKRAWEYLRNHGVSSLHATDLDKRKGQFKGWDYPARLAFVAGFAQILRSHVILGIGIATYKASFQASKKALGKSANKSAYGWCFTVIQDHLLRDEGIKHRLRTERLSFVVEKGNANDADVLRSFEAIKKEHNLSQLESLTFAKKNSTAALQAADLLAYYTRRHVTQRERSNQEQVEFAPALKALINCGIRYITFAATDFHG